VACLPTVFVNSYLIGEPLAPWVLVDTGLPGFAGRIERMAWERFRRPPRAILLTHGHFDHAGSAAQLAWMWKVPIYCGAAELPFLTSRSAYPPPDPTVGGFLAQASRAMPSRAIDLQPWVRSIPADGVLEELPGWRCLATPGHSPGHLSLFRESDRVLIAGDALATADYDSYIGAITATQQLWRAGTPFTCDWSAAETSARMLADLEPQVLACGHGAPMTGTDLPAKLRQFTSSFPRPRHGRYVAEPAITDQEFGVVSLPPAPADPMPMLAAGIAAGALLGHFVSGRKR
jgi:glyoxylase-like metal-dependent hydrolase (beta-lactamase superfamily II)